VSRKKYCICSRSALFSYYRTFLSVLVYCTPFVWVRHGNGNKRVFFCFEASALRPNAACSNDGIIPRRYAAPIPQFDSSHSYRPNQPRLISCHHREGFRRLGYMSTSSKNLAYPAHLYTVHSKLSKHFQ
jgi:hypothetical protein